MTKKQLKALAYLEAGTCVLTSCYDGVLDRIQDKLGQEDAVQLSEKDAAYLHKCIEDIADMLTMEGHNLWNRRKDLEKKIQKIGQLRPSQAAVQARLAHALEEMPHAETHYASGG